MLQATALSYAAARRVNRVARYEPARPPPPSAEGSVKHHDLWKASTPRKRWEREVKTPAAA
jgi:hypothetical protein